MHLPRPVRIITAFLALVALLFVQLAVAGHSCDVLGNAHQFANITVAADKSAHHCMTDCTGTGGEERSVCEKHCNPGDNSLDRPALPDLVASIPATLVFHVVDAYLPVQSATWRSDAFFLTRSVEPPLSVRNCCFRI